MPNKTWEQPPPPLGSQARSGSPAGAAAARRGGPLRSALSHCLLGLSPRQGRRRRRSRLLQVRLLRNRGPGLGGPRRLPPGVSPSTHAREPARTAPGRGRGGPLRGALARPSRLPAVGSPGSGGAMRGRGGGAEGSGRGFSARIPEAPGSGGSTCGAPRPSILGPSAGAAAGRETWEGAGNEVGAGGPGAPGRAQRRAAL